MAEQCELQDGVTAVIFNDGNALAIRNAEEELFQLTVPEHGIFYTFAKHERHGMCVVVAFDPPAMSTGWSDWYYRIDIAGQSIERVGPWR